MENIQKKGNDLHSAKCLLTSHPRTLLASLWSLLTFNLRVVRVTICQGVTQIIYPVFAYYTTINSSLTETSKSYSLCQNTRPHPKDDSPYVVIVDALFPRRVIHNQNPVSNHVNVDVECHAKLWHTVLPNHFPDWVSSLYFML